MPRLKLLLTAQTPLCIGDRRPAGQFRESIGYLPGSVLRGAVANLMLNDGLESDPAFQSCFNSYRQTIFSNAYPAPHVLPATAMSCKVEPGFRPKGHGVVDTLINRLCLESLSPPGLLYLPRCSQCRTRLERYSSFYRAYADGFRAEAVAQRLLTRVAINRRRATAEDQLLYSPIVISEGRWEASNSRDGQRDRNYVPTVFEATITVSEHVDVLETYLRMLDHIGSGTSRGLGLVTTEVELLDDDDRVSLRVRRENLNKEIEQHWARLKEWPHCTMPPHNPGTGSYFTIDLCSEAILREHGLLPAMIIKPEMLKERCGIDDQSLQLVRAYSGYDYRGGWNTAWRLPKDVDVVVPMGAVFVFWTEHPETWDQALFDLERHGIGERTAEGFGQVRVCGEFHQPGGFV